jgi:hypothetical protein
MNGLSLTVDVTPVSSTTKVKTRYLVPVKNAYARVFSMAWPDTTFPPGSVQEKSIVGGPEKTIVGHYHRRSACNATFVFVECANFARRPR